MNRPPILLAVAVVLAACAGPASRPGCTAAALGAAVEQALERGTAPAPADLACAVPAAVLERAWSEAACTGAGTWRIGLSGGSFPAACPDTRSLLEGHRLGREYAQLLDQLRPLPASGAVDPAQVRLVRERDVIRGIAQLRGWPLPDAPRTAP